MFHHVFPHPCALPACAQEISAELDQSAALVASEVQDGSSSEKGYFAKVISDIDDMVERLEQEQTADDNTKNACEVQLVQTHEEKVFQGAVLVRFQQSAGNRDKATVVFEDCDWLLEHYGLRKEARANEIDSLKKASGVLQGHDLA